MSSPYQQPVPQTRSAPQARQQPYQRVQQPPPGPGDGAGPGPGPGYGYVSPIPARRAHLGDALASEWTKLRSVRSTLWALGVLIVLMLGIGLLAAVLVATYSSDDAEFTNGDLLGLGFFGVLLGSMCVMTLGVLTIASEYGTGMIRTTLTACPSRARVLAAKSLVFFAVVFVISTLTTMVVAALQVAILDAGAPSSSEWFRATVGVSLYLATLGLLALAVGALVRHSAGAITVMIGVVLLPLVLAIFMFSESLSGLQTFLLEYSVPSQLTQFYGVSFTEEGGPRGWEPLWIIIGITAIAMTGAFFSLNNRDV
jgi:ABC-type transport system involved in multi-copper enzyme maturation permease subunit